MGLRCKPNELCFVLRGPSSGTVVTTIRFIGSVVGHNLSGDVVSVDDCWEVSAPDSAKVYKGAGWDGKVVCPDYALLPIRPNELKEDEEKEVTA